MSREQSQSSAEGDELFEPESVPSRYDELSPPRRAVRFVSDWLLLGGSRRRVTLTLLAGVYLVLFLLSVIWPFEVGRLLSETETIQRLFNTLLSGVILLVSIVVSINSVVVSEDLGTIGDQYDRVIDARKFREDAADQIGDDVSAVTPQRFLDQILSSVETELETVEEAVGADSDAREPFDTFREDTQEYIEATRRLLQSNNRGSLNTRVFKTEYGPSDEIAGARDLRHLETLSDEVNTALGNVINALHFFTAAREYFRSVYYKREFSRLSRDLLYIGLAAILLMSYVLLALDTQSFPGRTFGVRHLLLFINFAYVMALAPFLTLMSYVLRAAVVAEHVVTAGALVVE